MKNVMMVVGVALVIGLIGLKGVFLHTTSETVEVEVLDKERIAVGNNDQTEHKYLVYTEGEVFENTDSLWFLKFDSSDVYGKLSPGESYTVRVAGWRIRHMDMYRNIIEVK